MAENQIVFKDGAGYEQYMGIWSRLVGNTFLNWVSPKSGLRWVDVGCGNGAFTEMIVERCAPLSVYGIDPSEDQLAYAKTRFTSELVELHTGDAMALPLPSRSVDIAVMPLVIFFVPDPARGVAEMVRVVAPGGWVCAYAWDLPGGGFPYEVCKVALKELSVIVPQPPSVDVAKIEVLRDVWQSAGLMDVETKEIVVERTFENFGAYWDVLMKGPSIAASFSGLSPKNIASLKSTLCQRLPAMSNGNIVCSARANAVKGRVRAMAQ